MSTPKIAEQETLVDLDNIDEQESSNQSKLNKHSPTLSPFHRQFTVKLFTLAVSITFALFLVIVLLWHHNQQSQLIVETQLQPLQQQVQQLESLHKTQIIVDDLLSGNSEQNWLALHTELTALNRELLRLNSNHSNLYRQWLNQNKLASETVSRAETNKSRNQQLKQSSVIQLQLMLFSITRIHDQNISHEQMLYQQLQTDNRNDNVTVSRANAYVNAVKQSQTVKQLQTILTELLTSFESLSIGTSQIDFDLMRLAVDQLIAQSKLLSGKDTKSISEFISQVDSFIGIVLTDQMALAKWQGYLRLMQSYTLDLKAQQQQVIELLSEKQSLQGNRAHSSIGLFLSQLNIPLSSNEISLLLLSLISLALAIYFTLLWKMKQQIKLASQQSLAIISQSIQGDDENKLQANCLETDEILKQIQLLEKPEHSEQEYQTLLAKIKDKEIFIEEQKQKLIQVTEHSDEEQLEQSKQVATLNSHELTRYSHLKKVLKSQIVQAHRHLTQKDNGGQSITTPLLKLYDSIEQFELASYLQSDNAVLSLEDVNLVETLYSIIFNKQQEQLKNNNQLFISHDEHIFEQVNIDNQIFQHLFKLLVEISLYQCKDAIFHLHLQLQDKNAGQQVVSFVIKVNCDNLTELPSMITDLTQVEHNNIKTTHVEVFNTLFKQLHGDNIASNVIDDGYQLSFELPLAIANQNSQLIQQKQEEDSTVLADTKTMLLTGNKVVTSIIEKLVLSCAGKFEAIARMDSFSQLLSVNNLRRHKIDLVIVGSDVACKQLNAIEQLLVSLPQSMRPKLMILQSTTLSVQKFGLYTQFEQPLCKGSLIENIKNTLKSEQENNLHLPPSQFQHQAYHASQATVLLAVNSPQHYQNMHRLLLWLGLQVQFVCDEQSQNKHWDTGRYCLLFSEFTQTSWLDMSLQPAENVGIFSLSSSIKLPASKSSKQKELFNQWYCGELTVSSSLAELEDKLSPWLILAPNDRQLDALSKEKASQKEAQFSESILADENKLEYKFIINEVSACLSAEANVNASFNFSRYLKHQGTVELALFMLDDYTQDNHLHLKNLSSAINSENLANAKVSIEKLQLNGQILAAEGVQVVCLKWFELLNTKKPFNKTKQIEALLKETEQVLQAVDSYAETI